MTSFLFSATVIAGSSLFSVDGAEPIGQLEVKISDLAEHVLFACLDRLSDCRGSSVGYPGGSAWARGYADLVFEAVAAPDWSG